MTKMQVLTVVCVLVPEFHFTAYNNSFFTTDVHGIRKRSTLCIVSVNKAVPKRTFSDSIGLYWYYWYLSGRNRKELRSFPVA